MEELYAVIEKSYRCDVCDEDRIVSATPDGVLTKVEEDGDSDAVSMWWINKAESQGWIIDDEMAIEPECSEAASFGV